MTLSPAGLSVEYAKPLLQRNDQGPGLQRPRGSPGVPRDPGAAPLQPHVNARLRSRESSVLAPLPLPSLQSARTSMREGGRGSERVRESEREEGAPGDSAADAIILCFPAAWTSPSCSPRARSRPCRYPGSAGARLCGPRGAGRRLGAGPQARGFLRLHRGLTARATNFLYKFCQQRRF